MSNQVLFICTGNFYRSRFAEMLFNHHAAARQIDLRAISRGLATHLVDGCGPISPHTVAALKSLQVEIPSKHRNPISLSRLDLEQSLRVIAVKETEHRPLLLERFPDWADRVHYWEVHDLDMATPVQALGELQVLVRNLADEMGSQARELF